jgi:hypothetical protein
MVVDHDDARRRFRDRRPEDLPGVDQGAVQQAPGDEHLAQHLTLGVQGEKVELLHLEVSETAAEQANHVFRLSNALDRGPFFPGEPGTEFEAGEQAGRLGGTDPLEV